MLSGVLRSSIAVDVNIRIMRAFVSMRRTLATIAPVIARVSEIERMQLEERTSRQADRARGDGGVHSNPAHRRQDVLGAGERTRVGVAASPSTLI